MKTSILLILFAAFTTTPLAHAAELCGQLGMEIVGPHCQPGRMCPHYLMQRFFLLIEGKKTVVQTSSFEVLEQFSDLKGEVVCATGTPSRNPVGAFDVSEIHAR